MSETSILGYEIRPSRGVRISLVFQAETLRPVYAIYFLIVFLLYVVFLWETLRPVSPVCFLIQDHIILKYVLNSRRHLLLQSFWRWFIYVKPSGGGEHSLLIMLIGGKDYPTSIDTLAARHSHIVRQPNDTCNTFSTTWYLLHDIFFRVLHYIRETPKK